MDTLVLTSLPEGLVYYSMFRMLLMLLMQRLQREDDQPLRRDVD